MTTTTKREWKTYFRALGGRITELRKYQGLTQAELARALGVSQQTVFAYELGDRRVTVPLIPNLAKVLAVTVEELIGITSPPRARAPRRSPKVLRHAKRIQQLSKTQQRFVIRIIDLLLEHSNNIDSPPLTRLILRSDAAAMSVQASAAGVTARTNYHPSAT